MIHSVRKEGPREMGSNESDNDTKFLSVQRECLKMAEWKKGV